MKDGEEPSESSPKRQRREEPIGVAACESASEPASSQHPETQSDDNTNNKAASSASRPEVQLQTPKVFIGGLHRNVTETHVGKFCRVVHLIPSIDAR
jgi:hypothetical protein